MADLQWRRLLAYSNVWVHRFRNEGKRMPISTARCERGCETRLGWSVCEQRSGIHDALADLLHELPHATVAPHQLAHEFSEGNETIFDVVERYRRLLCESLQSH